MCQTYHYANIVVSMFPSTCALRAHRPVGKTIQSVVPIMYDEFYDKENAGDHGMQNLIQTESQGGPSKKVMFWLRSGG